MSFLTAMNREMVNRDCFVDGCKAVNAFETFGLVEGDKEN